MKNGHAIIEPEALRGAATQAVAALKLLANRERLLLLCQIAKGRSCVSELEEELDIHQPTLSQQLGVLRRDGVVDTERDGKNIYYSIRDPRMLEILETLYRIYCPPKQSKSK
ncbi:MAG: winged helix-turn-helix transcriptional regulator [Burkholderiales bacterium]|jgi:ArsR family transcriptional regulator|nr:winged helix-turn-helix transcriptional regulator [Burkholderiales bacterium]